MSHARQQIRSAIAAAVTGLSTTGSSVHRSRVYNLEAGDLPALKVYTLNETSEADTMAPPREYMRELQVIIEAAARASTDLDNTLDTICAEVETALAVSSTLGGLAHGITLQSTDIELQDGGDQPIGVARMTWLVYYRTAENAPGTALL